MLPATTSVSFQEVSESGYSFDATRHREKNRQSQAEHDRHHVLLMQIPTAVAFVKGPEHVVELANEACLKLVCGREIIGMPIRYALPELAVQGIFEQLDQVLAGGQSLVRREVCFRLRHTADGPHEKTCFDFAYQPVKEADGQISGILIHATDVTERVKSRHREAQLRELKASLERRLNERTEELEVRNRELQQFASVANHDLQEPLRKLRTFADLLKAEYGDRLDENAHAYLDRLHSAASRMSDLVRDMIAYFNIRTHSEKFRSFHVDELVQQVLRDLDMAITAAGAHMEVVGNAELCADHGQLRQMLHHLLANALTFMTPGRKPHVKVILSEGCNLDGKDVCRIAIIDNGIGFAEEYAERIFEPYQRLHGRNEYPGTGMGLAICRRIAERHGGTIRAMSTPGSGSRFIVELPRFQPEEYAGG